MGQFKTFVYKEAKIRISTSCFNAVQKEIIKQRHFLEDFIKKRPAFLKALTPVSVPSSAPQIVKRMQAAALLTHMGPMAAVAGTMAQMGAEAAIRQGYQDVVIENGGDIYINTQKQITIGLYAGLNPLADQLAFLVKPELLPLAVCSSSSKMGHSLSLGNCDLVTVFAKNASLADAAATMACNQVKSVKDLEPVANQALKIPGLMGITIIKEEKICLAGQVPPLVKHQDKKFSDKITIHALITFDPD